MSDQDQPQAQGQEQPRRETSPQHAERERGVGGSRRPGGRRRNRHSSQQPQGGQPSQRRQQEEASLNMAELRDLVDLFTSNGLAEFEFENAEIRVRLSRNLTAQAGDAAAAAQPQASQAGAAQPQPSPASSPAAPQADATTSGAAEPAEDLHIITSPIVGTFYRSPSPNADPFVRVGSTVAPETTVCIIEAMKLMNEIQAETSGTIEKIFVENGQPVEYGQPLFGVKR